MQDFIETLQQSTLASSRLEEALKLKDQHLPSRIYKYRCDTEHSRENLRNDSVRMASPLSYNDPYDSFLTFPISNLQQLLEARLVDKFIAITKLQDVLSPIQIANAKGTAKPLNNIAEYLKLKGALAEKYWSEKAASYSELLQDEAQKTIASLEGFREKLKVCSFSDRNDSLLMWSHYASHHKGFCIEYNLEKLRPDEFFRKNLYPTLYSNQFCDLLPFVNSLVSGPATALQNMRPLIAMLHKHEGWKYEDEWRLLEEYENTIADFNQNAPMPSRVFLGARFNLSDSRELLAICEEKNIPIFQMRLAQDKFELKIEEFQP